MLSLKIKQIFQTFRFKLRIETKRLNTKALFKILNPVGGLCSDYGLSSHNRSLGCKCRHYCSKHKGCS